ncbi:hypothetical protein VSDG_06440 [Cytospora chrysosperma]|uniref:BTB domain-containing protein n=1 Tax=Cytospora chrysosperma TaxID=252740 RepID=A0A423VLF2_CYTCH|nr:hypothetical protein VSDG_06440 [Valsa sordida]
MSDQGDQKNEGSPSVDANSTKQSLSFEAQHLVTVMVEGKVFKAQKAVLVKDSLYFDRALNGPFREGQTQTIDLEDDVDANDFVFYVEVAYRSYFNEDFKLRKEHLGACFQERLRTVLNLWVLTDRFLNGRLRAIATEGLEWLLRVFDVRNWEFHYKSASTPHQDLLYWITLLQSGFKECLEFDTPLKDKFAEAAAAMPPQLFSELHDTLDPEFRSAVTKKFIKRFEDPKLRRPLVEDESLPAKRKKTN